MTKKLDSEYVKNLENENSRLDDVNYSNSVEMRKLQDRIKQLETVNEIFSNCMSELMEKCGYDIKVVQITSKALNQSAKALVKK